MPRSTSPPGSRRSERRAAAGGQPTEITPRVLTNPRERRVDDVRRRQAPAQRRGQTEAIDGEHLREPFAQARRCRRPLLLQPGGVLFWPAAPRPRRCARAAAAAQPDGRPTSRGSPRSRRATPPARAGDVPSGRTTRPGRPPPSPAVPASRSRYTGRGTPGGHRRARRAPAAAPGSRLNAKLAARCPPVMLGHGWSILLVDSPLSCHRTGKESPPASAQLNSNTVWDIPSSMWISRRSSRPFTRRARRTVPPLTANAPSSRSTL